MNDKWEIIQGDALKLLGGFPPGTFKTEGRSDCAMVLPFRVALDTAA